MRTTHPVIFFFIYVPYLIFPALVWLRLWRENPFSSPLPPRTDLFIKVAASVTYFLFAAAGIAWFFECEVNDAAKAACRDLKYDYAVSGVPAALTSWLRGIAAVVYAGAWAAGIQWMRTGKVFSF